MKQILYAGIVSLCATALHAESHSVTYDYDGSFEDATFSVENAIIGKGLVIDYVSHVGDMLNRTGADVGSDVEIFESADVFLFCSALVSRKVMEADPSNVAHCPYSIFVTDTAGKVAVGYPTYPEGPMQDVQALLDDIVKSAMGGF